MVWMPPPDEHAAWAVRAPLLFGKGGAGGKAWLSPTANG